MAKPAGRSSPPGYSCCSRRAHRSPPSQGWAEAAEVHLKNQVSGLDGVGTEEGAGVGFIFLPSVLRGNTPG